MANGKFVSYCRVSTARQGASGLGLEAQQQAINSYLNGGDWQILGEYVEVESGKKNDRPKLKEALALCELTGATLIIAKLDRLARNVKFISTLMDTDVDFVAVDFPEANRLTIHILAAVAEHEGRMISERIRNAYGAYTARGGKEYNEAHGKKGWGCPDNLTEEAKEKASPAGNLVKTVQADAFAAKMAPIIKGYQVQGLSLRQIAATLNDKGVLTARSMSKAAKASKAPEGKVYPWTAQAVKNVLLRVVA